jgi:class 3 adenylate cyclase
VAKEQAAVEVLTPAARERRPLPKLALGLLGIAVLVAIVNQPRASEFTRMLDAFTKVVAVLSCAGLAAWLEERIYTALVGRTLFLRVPVALALPPLALIGGAVAAAAFGSVTSALGDDDHLLLAMLLGAFWMASAAVGTAIVVLLDAAISAVVSGFRSRIQLAVLSLIALAAASATGFGFAALRAGREVRSRGPAVVDAGAELDLGFETFKGAEVAELLSQPDTEWVVALFIVLVMALLCVPAVLSACGKLADAVMERFHPLKLAFAAIGEGRLNVRVEEGGSKDFRVLAWSFNQMVEQLALSRQMERAFGQYVSGQVLDRIRAQHGEAALPAALREATVFFADVRGFTAMSERLEPGAVLDVLNRYFERVVGVIDRHEGYLDKFIGDAVVVVFNGPIDQPDHAERAVRCAIALQEEVARLNEAGIFPEIGAVQVGVGIATGPLVAGNLGSRNHMEYTVIGDTVNLASRLTGKAPAGEVWVNERCAEALPPDLPRAQLSPLSVKGKARPVEAYRVWPVEAAAESVAERRVTG